MKKWFVQGEKGSGLPIFAHNPFSKLFGTAFRIYAMDRLVFNPGALFLYLLFFAYCSKSPMPVATALTAPDTLQVQDSLRYLALGDSYTIGESVSEQERFPNLTATLLRAQHISISDPQYIATTGWTTLNLLTAIEQTPALGTYDVVSLLCGVNDQYQHLDTAGYRTRFALLLDKATALAGNRPNRVFVLSIPDYSATPFVAEMEKARVRSGIDAFNAINKELTLARNIAYIDITPLTREAITDATLLASDGLHYSGKEHQKWAMLLAPVIKRNLQ